MARKVGGNA